jgi:hypothetical protein
MSLHPDDTTPPMKPAPSCATHDERMVFIEETVRDIKIALVGNKLGQKGVIPRLADAEEKFAAHIVEDDRRFTRVENTVKWASGALAGVVAAFKFWEFTKK